MAKKYYRSDLPQQISRFKLRLEELTPPAMQRSTAHQRFTAELHRLNAFFWSTEIALSTCITRCLPFEDGTQSASDVLNDVGAHAFQHGVSSKTAHYRAKIGSLLIQLRWNYDALGRQILIESITIAEELVKARLAAIYRAEPPSSFEALFETASRKGLFLDPLATFRAQVFKLLRNNVIHRPSTIHNFPNESMRAQVKRFTESASKWISSDAEQLQKMAAASNEILVSTKLAARTYDVPQLFIAAIYCLTRIRQFGDSVEAAMCAWESVNRKTSPK